MIRAREYLISVFENSDEELADRMRAIAQSRKVEAAKVSPKVIHLNRRTALDRKEAWRTYELSQLRTKIILATHDVPPKGSDDVRLATIICHRRVKIGRPGGMRRASVDEGPMGLTRDDCCLKSHLQGARVF